MKNIIICSDGTGNSGGTGHSTNVYRLYKAVETLGFTNQVTFYDDGIASSGFKYFRTASAALGFGFHNNVARIYRYLVKHYEPGDKVFMFGFSRGAATVRAVAGMIEHLGLLRKDSDEVTIAGRIDDIKLRLVVMKMMRWYKRGTKNTKIITDYKEKHTLGSIDIEMIGVWDTVSALGFPRDSSWTVIATSKILDKLSDYIMPHNYFDYQLTDSVKNVYHALAIDDDRYTFHPILWDETAENRPVNIEQVWFAGAHANVGGGYPRTGLSMITLNWMIKKAITHGLKFNYDLITDIEVGMNSTGKMYNPREGVHIYYRFSPRHIRDLSNHRKVSILTGEIKVHESVIERIANIDYAPILPNRFEIVSTDSKIKPILCNENQDLVKRLKKRVNLLIKLRTWSYHGLTEITFIIAFMTWYLHSYAPVVPVDSVMFNNIIDLLPTFTDNFLYYSIYTNRLFGIIMLLSFLILLGGHKILKLLTTRIRKRINWWLLKNIE